MTAGWTFADYDRRVQRCHDERRDPLDDAEVVAWLEAHPERLAMFAAERHALAALASGHAAPARARHPVVAPAPLALVAATLLASLALLFARSGRPARDGAAAPRILAAELDELRATAGLSVTFLEREVLLATGDASLESFTIHTTTR